MVACNEPALLGDNLKVLREEIADASVDLIYLDPPFNSQANYNVLFKGPKGDRSAAQIEAFTDTWSWCDETERAFDDVIRSSHVAAAELLRALRSVLPDNDLMAYLAMMAVRLLELHRVLKSSGSLYLHCDPTASHYLKILLDAIFGAERFRSEIVWKRSSAHSDSKQGRRQHGRIHDILLFYAKSAAWTWHQQYTPYDETYVKNTYRYTEPDTGRRYALGDLAGPGGAMKGNPRYEVLGVTRHWRFSRERMAELIAEGRVVQPRPGTVPRYKRYLDELSGVPLQDLWTDLPPVAAQAQERLGYPTQKPLALLERIIASSSNKGDVVLDPFCGCGTAVHAAQTLDRRWIGIDVTHLAIALIEQRMKDAFPAVAWEVHGTPKDLAGAKALAARDKYQFQWWALSLLGATPTEAARKKGADGGIDGVIWFKPDGRNTEKAIVSVKGGNNLSVTIVRELAHVVDREGAKLGILVTLAKPTGPMREAAATVGACTTGYCRYSKLQILTIRELLAGQKPDLPLLDHPSSQRPPRPPAPMTQPALL